MKRKTALFLALAKQLNKELETQSGFFDKTHEWLFDESKPVRITPLSHEDEQIRQENTQAIQQITKEIEAL